jgi:Glycosyl transferase family 2
LTVPGALEQLRAKLWPTRRLYEHRNAELHQELAALRQTIDQLSERQQLMVLWQAEMRTRLRRTQALAARAYERLQDWPSQLAAARRHPDYEHAYTDPEPLITVAMSTYHSPDTLVDVALASVRAQTYLNWEAIVVGDHCTDDTAARVEAIGDPRIRFYNLPVRENDSADPFERYAVKGSVPRAVAIDQAKGTWIAPLSHDDAWHPDHLATLLDAARETRAEWIYSRMEMVDVTEPGEPRIRSCGAWPPRLGDFACQCSLLHGLLRFLKYDRACALASEPNDWNLGRRAWEAGVRFHFVDRETATLRFHPRGEELRAEYEAIGLPLEAAAYP